MVALSTGCSSAPSLEPKRKVPVPFATNVARAQATVNVLDEVDIQLPTPAKTGDTWTIVFNDARFLKQLAPIEPTGESGFAARFLAVRNGRRLVRFFTLPSGREVEPSQIYEVVIQIDAINQ